MKKLKTILALLLCFAIVFSFFVFFNLKDSTAEAATSLPGIEEIKQNSDTFNILEIVPQEGSGSIGWYISGQEPGANWAHDQLASLTSYSARQGAADAYLASLESAGLLGLSGTPLFKTGGYVEYFPWNAPSDVSGLNTLVLSSEESYTLTAGAFTDVTAGGEYRADNIYTVASGGYYDQDISGLTALTSAYTDGNTHYYYTIGAFAPLDSGKSVYDGLLIYRVVDFVDADSDGLADDPYDIIIKASDYSVVPAAEAGSYSSDELVFLFFNGCMGSSYLTGLNLLSEYFTVPFTVSTDYNASQPQYEAVADGFVQVSPDNEGNYNGHFNATTISYTYVGHGSAEAEYSYSTTGGTYTGPYIVKTNTVYYTGGFTNNNWFLTYVFDWESGESAPAITVKSATPGSVTTADVSSADLIVLSNGRGNTSVYSSGNDISGDIETAISSISALKMPIIVDCALCSLGSLNIGQLAASLTSGSSETHYVNDNIYCIDTALATNEFNDPIDGDHESTSDPFYDVWYEINYENFLRIQNDPDATTLSETVSSATCVRYVINYGGRRVISKKSSISVLELQPGEGHYLTESKVSEWTGLPTASITIDTLSTAEFIGKIDDLVEKYDLVYIGSDVTGFSTNYYGKTQYTDSDMNGLIYTNIGDIYLSGYNLTGLLDRDYGSYYSGGYRVINYSNTSRTYRLSGNDITPGKVSELLDYAAAGYPIVVSNDLLSGTLGQEAFSFKAELAESSDGVLTATAVATSGTISSSLTKTYQWYMDDGSGYRPISTSGSIATLEEAGTFHYYCTITISGETARSNTAIVVVSGEGFTAEPVNPSLEEAADWGNNSGGTAYQLTVTVTDDHNSNTYNQFDLSISPNDDSNISYQWYGANNSYGNSEKLLSGETSSTFIDRYTYNYYFCRVTIFGCELDSNIVRWNSLGTSSVTRKIFRAAIAASTDMTSATLTASFDPAIGYSSNRSVVWYRNGGYYSTDTSSPYTLTVTQPGTYYCYARYYGSAYMARSNSYIVGGGGWNTDVTLDSDYGSPATVDAIPPQYDISTETVDYCSNVYTFLNSVADYANTFTETGASANSNTLIQYLNLSKPEIVFSEDAYGTPLYPTKYTGPDGLSLPGKTLSYTFTINNATDVTPAETRYYCNFYLDMNADGRYDYTEQLADIRIADGSGNIIRSGELRAGVEYTVTRTMPNEYVGIIPWQLEVVKTSQSRVHASQHGYTHISGTPKTIYILQILHNSGGLNLTTNSTYQSLFSQVDDFNLDISTIRAGDLSSVHSGSVVRLNEEGVSETVTYSNLEEYLNTFDMLILGFADTYGELDRTAAGAVVDFINNPTGKAVLFTHDTTSFVNLPFSPYPATDYHTVSTSTWGYYFNTILRDSVGLDRYGVTNPDYGVTAYSPNKSGLTDNSPGINVADNNSSNSIHGETELSAVDISTLTAAGYSIAYEPVSRESVDSGTTKTMISEIQGFTNYNLYRYRDNSDHGTTQTTRVSQVNEGQITTYPFDLNLCGFGDNTNPTDNTMSIANTHEQYYQLNMNPADIVVWYCLAGSGYNDSYGDPLNDVVNSYYIYSIGNVTYSGAGHSGNSVTEDEAKLFINTMIAAFRTATTPPEIAIVDPDTGDVLTDKFYVGDEASLLASPGNLLADSAIYFTVTDPSLGAGKVITASFGFDGNSTGLKIYVKDGSASPINFDSYDNPKSYSLSGGVTYYVYPSSELLAYIHVNGSAVLTVTITSNLLPSQPASAQITLHELGLFPLD